MEQGERLEDLIIMIFLRHNDINGVYLRENGVEIASGKRKNGSYIEVLHSGINFFSRLNFLYYEK